MPLQALQSLERKIGHHIRQFETRNGIRLDDEVKFIRSWIEKPLTMGSVTPSSRALARAMASYVDPDATGPVIELGPGTGPITEALVQHGVKPSRLVLVEYTPTFCRMLRQRYPAATVIQGDAYTLPHTLAGVIEEPVSAVVSGLPLLTKPLKTRLRLIRDAFAMMAPNAPFVQFTYAASVAPIPKGLSGVSAQPSDRIWKNFPPARVWVYREEKH